MQYSCTGTEDGAIPAIRIQYLIEQLNPPEDLPWAVTSICDNNFATALQGIGSRVRGLLEHQCLPAPLHHCPDPGAAFGSASDGCSLNDACLPICDILEVVNPGTLEETWSQPPPCLEVCPTGLCVGNLDPLRAYAAGHPAKRDLLLPVPNCWHIAYRPLCSAAKGAELVVSRADYPEPNAYIQFTCQTILSNEVACEDGLDNDEDCLADGDDPDCQAP